MIVVTTYLVKPVNANDVVLPTDGYGADAAATDSGRKAAAAQVTGDQERQAEKGFGLN